MTGRRVDYDQIAPQYNKRFASGSRSGTAQALLGLARTLQAGRILEVGCGTGHWLAALNAIAPELYGLDPSTGMLRQALARQQPMQLVRGFARHLPFENGAIGLAFCVNAIHHFQDPRSFIGEAHRVLATGGTLAIIGTDPHGRKESWYAYHFFEGMYERDLERFPAWATVSEWMAEMGLEGIELQQMERIVETKHGRQVLDDPYLGKNASSQLALLSEETYLAGLQRIEAAVSQAEARGETILFRTDIRMSMLTGHKAKAT